jgi:phage gpG-like protein
MAGPTTLSGITMGNAPGGAMPIKVDFDPLPIILAGKFDKLGLDIRSFREPLKRSIQQVMIPSIAKNFDSGGRPRWPALTTDTEILREANGFSKGPALIRSGLLKRAATQLNLWTITPESAYVADMSVPQAGKSWYGVAQQMGYTGGYGAVTPPRPFLMIQEEDIPEIEEVFLIWIEERMLLAGFSLTPEA